MSISTRVESIETHLSSDYEGLENIGADLTGINKNILNIRTILDTIYNDMPKVTGEGTEVTLTPTRKGRLALIPKGNSTQESTNGYNLFNGILELGIINGATGQDQNNNNYIRTKDYIPVKELTSYVISTPDIVTGNLYIYEYKADYTYNLTTNISKAYGVSWVTQEGTAYVRFRPGMQTTDTSLKFQLEEGSTATTYEQYTGGIPAPNPNYPFPIKSVTGNNNVVVKTPNLVIDSDTFGGTDWTNLNHWTEVTEKYNGLKVYKRASAWLGIYKTIQVEANKTYTFSAYVKSDTSRVVVLTVGGGTSGASGDRYLTSTSTWTRFSITFTPTQSGTIRPRIENTSELSDYTYICGYQVEESPTATDYINGANQTKPLNLGTIELNKIGTYKNLIFKAENGDLYYDSLTAEQKALLTYGARYYHEEIGKVVFDGSEDENWIKMNADLTNTVAFALSNSVTPTQTPIGLCNNFIQTTGWSYLLTTDSNMFQIYYDKTTYIRINSTLANDVASFKTWLSTHNTEIRYALATPTDIEITDTQLVEQLNEIEKMQSYNGTTIITSTNEGTCDIIIGASALKNAE